MSTVSFHRIRIREIWERTLHFRVFCRQGSWGLLVLFVAELRWWPSRRFKCVAPRGPWVSVGVFILHKGLTKSGCREAEGLAHSTLVNDMAKVVEIDSRGPTLYHFV